MPGPAAQPSRQFFNAKNTLERKHLGEFLHELQALQVRGLDAWAGGSRNACPGMLEACQRLQASSSALLGTCAPHGCMPGMRLLA